MFDHIGISVGDLVVSRRFYDGALAALGYKVVMELSWGEDSGLGFGDTRPYFWVSTKKGTVSAGVHIAFGAKDRATVDAFYAAAMDAGGRDNGAPGPRTIYHPNYYGAFVLDPDGNNVEAVCHGGEVDG